MNLEISNVIDMNKRDLEKLSKAELMKMVKKLQKKAKIVIVDDDYRPVPPPRTYKPIPAPSANETIKKPVPKPSKSVKQMVNEYEDLILPPPSQFRDGYKPVPASRTDKSQKQPRRLPPGGPKTGHFISRRQSELIVQKNQKPPKPIRRPPQRPPQPPPPQQPPIQKPIGIPVPAPMIKNRAPKIEKLDQALKGHTALYTTEIQDNLDPTNHFTKTKEVVESHLKDLLKTMKGFKFIITLEVTFEKNTFDSKTGKLEFIHKTAYFSSKAKTITNANEIESELHTSPQEILGIIEVCISEGSGWTIDRVDNNYINVVSYKPCMKWIELHRTTNRT